MKKKNKSWGLVASVVFSLLLIGTVNANGADKVFKWRMQSFMPSGSSVHGYLQTFVRNVEKATGGRLLITLYPAGALFPPTEGFKSVSSGVIEMTYDYSPFYQGVIKDALAFHPPFGLQRWEDVYTLYYYGGWKEIVHPKYVQHNIHRAAITAAGAEPIWSKVPIRSMKDFKGLRMRATGAAANFFAKKLGVSVSTLPGPELYTALKLGTIDALEYSSGAYDYDLGLHEVTNYIILPHYIGAVPIDFLVNLKAYKELPEDIRTAFDMTCTWAEQYITYMTEKDSKIAIQKMIKEGPMEVIYLPDEDVGKITELARQFWDEELASISPDAAKMIELYKNKAKQVGILK